MHRVLCFPCVFVAALVVSLNLSACGNANPCARAATSRRPLQAGAVAAVSVKPPTAHSISPCAAGLEKARAIAVDFERPGSGTFWFSYSDGSAGGVLRQEASTFEPGQRALHVTASGFREWGAGVGVTLGELAAAQAPCEFDGSAYSGVRFRAKGHGAMRFAVATVPSMPIADGGSCRGGPACYDFPGANVSLKPEWETFEFAFCNLTPVGWGEASARVDPHRLFSLQFRLPNGMDHDVWLDDVALIPRSAASDAARCGPVCPLAAVPPDADIEPGRLSTDHAAAGLSVHTFAQETKSCGPLTRRYLEYLPKRLPKGSAAPVVILLHGAAASAEAFRDFQTHARFEALSERDGFIVVYGNAAPGPSSSNWPNSGSWVQSPDSTDEVDDVGYLDGVRKDMLRREVINSKSPIFLVGQSNGGGMVLEAARLHPERYAGVAALMPFVGPSPGPVALPSSAHLSRVLIAYSLTDPGLPTGHALVLKKVADSWARALGIPANVIATPLRTALPNPVDEGASYSGQVANALATRQSHGEQLDLFSPSKGESANAVRLLIFEHAGHFWPNPVQDTWPEALERWGLRNQDIDAADAVWDFLRGAVSQRARAHAAGRFSAGDPRSASGGASAVR